MRKIFLQLSVACLSIVLLNACVEVQDVLAPSIVLEIDDTDGAFRDTYYYGDSINFQVSFRDNSSITRSEVAITRIGSELTDTVSSWGLYITEPDSLTGSRFVNRDVALEVPAIFNGDYLATGLYAVYLSVEDRGGSIITISDTFNIEDDITPPVFSDVEIDLPEISTDEYEVCPGLVIPIRAGTVTDNTRIKFLRYKIGDNATRNLPRVDGAQVNDEVVLSEFFSGGFSIKIGNDFPATGSETVVVSAVDEFNNTSSFSFTITSNCDIESPQIQVLGTSPQINSDNFTTVVSGQQFRIGVDSLLVVDNNELDRVEVYFREGSSDDLLLYQENSIGTAEISLGDYNFPDAFTSFQDSDIGKTFTITIKAFDTEGNQSADEIIELAVELDDAPEIPTLDFVINRNGPKDTTFFNVSDGGIYDLSRTADDAILIDPTFINFMLPEGKAEDDVGILSVEMTWTRITPTVTVLESVLVGDGGLPFEGGEVNPKVIQFSDYVTNSSFIFDMSGTFEFEITIEDTKGQTHTTTYQLVR